MNDTNQQQDGRSEGWDRADLVEGTSLWQDAFRRLIKNRAAMTGLIIVVLMGLAAIFYEPISMYVTNYRLDEQHQFISAKPPGARSVPFYYYSLLDPTGEAAFDAVDKDGNGQISSREIERFYRQYEFDIIDTDNDGNLSFSEFVAAPLSRPSNLENLPSCDVWDIKKQNAAPLERRKLFMCDAGEDGKMTFEETGDVVALVNPSEASTLLRFLDENDDGALTKPEYNGLPAPETNWLGTDGLGRDVLTRLVYGARISLSVGLLAALVSFVIGVSWGATAGFLGGTVDNIMMRIVDTMYGLPFMILVILLMSVFGQSLLLLFVAIGAIRWLTMARIVRGQVISLKEQEFVEAAETIGVSKAGIIFKHLIPNALGPIIVYTTLMVPSVMLAEAFLSFLGLGIRAPYTSWGLMASEGRQMMESAPWLILASGGALAVTLLSLNFLGDGLRDALDPQTED
jgi:oligopeptide transport system permease protein